MDPFTLFLIGTATVFQVSAQRKSASAQQNEIERQAKEEKIAGQTEELSRRERLNKILAANVQSASAMGIPLEGSIEAVSLQSAQKAATSEGAQSLSDQLRQDIFKRRSQTAKMVGSMNTKATLLNTALAVSELR